MTTPHESALTTALAKTVFSKTIRAVIEQAESESYLVTKRLLAELPPVQVPHLSFQWNTSDINTPTALDVLQIETTGNEMLQALVQIYKIRGQPCTPENLRRLAFNVACITGLKHLTSRSPFAQHNAYGLSLKMQYELIDAFEKKHHIPTTFEELVVV